MNIEEINSLNKTLITLKKQNKQLYYWKVDGDADVIEVTNIIVQEKESIALNIIVQVKESIALLQNGRYLNLGDVLQASFMVRVSSVKDIKFADLA
jgi:5-formyltetrahydrofolate cyclo-ligase